MYEQEISRKNPTALLFLIDQSGSMGEPIRGLDGKRKCDAVADAINRLLLETLVKCSKGFSNVRDYFYIGVIGYGRDNNIVGSAFSGQLAGRDLVAISEIALKPARIEVRSKDDGAGGVAQFKLPVWFEPVAEGWTPMCKALEYATVVTGRWLQEHPDCYPPVIINITDGVSTDGSPIELADQLKRMGSSDGNVMLFNLHISQMTSAEQIFPNDLRTIADENARTLFQMSSPLTAKMQAYLRENYPAYEVNEYSRGFVYNGDIVSVIMALNVGTQHHIGVTPESGQPR